MTINAFHKDYIKTYMPEFLTKIRTESVQHTNGVINGGKSRKDKPYTTEVTYFHIYSKAGAK